MFRRPLLSLILLVAAAPSAARAARAQLIAGFDDDAGDATGPGSYQRPGDSDLQDGDFDLRRFEVWLDGDDVVFKVTMGAPFRRPEVTARSTATPIPLWNNIYYQNIDIYVDSDRAPGKGFSECVPGRRVAFAGGRTWEAAVVLTPQPGPARAVTEAALGAAGKHVLFPKDLQAHGRTVIARVPASALGGRPDASWGWSVHVSGARWERTFRVVERIARGKPQPDAFTMPVVAIAEAWAFGGAPEGNAHPYVVDVLLPRGANQAAVLGSFDVASGAFARVPFVDASGVVAAAETPAPAGLTVVDVADATVTVGGPVEGLKPLMIGRVLDASGATVARIVVVRVVAGGVVADAVDGADKIKRGAAVRFDSR